MIRNQIIEVDAMANIHTHLREGEELMRALIKAAILGGVDTLGPMPNTSVPLMKCGQVLEYIRMAQKVCPKASPLRFVPIAQINEDTTPEDVMECIEAGVKDFKIYPKDRTTKSKYGVVRYGKMVNIISASSNMARAKGKVMKVHNHPEHPSMAFYNRDAEFAFLPIAKMMLEETSAIIIWEHGTDSRCIPLWKEFAETGRFYVTLTAHHLASNEDRAFGDVRSVCKPPIKLESDRLQLISLVMEDYSWVIAAGDDAAHPTADKQVDEGRCACGSYTSPFLVPLYAHALGAFLDTINGVNVFDRFISKNARRLYNLPAASSKIVLGRQDWKIPGKYTLGPWEVMPFWAGETLKWTKLAHSDA